MEIKRACLFTHHTLSDRERRNLTIFDAIRRKTNIPESNLSKITGYGVGAEINTFVLRAVLVDMRLHIINKITVARNSASYEVIAEKIGGMVKDLAKEASLEPGKIKSIGIGLRETALLPAAELVQKALKIETCYGNEAACAAFGEKTLNPAADVEDLLYLYSDIGCGIIIKDDIYIGSCGLAGEMKISEENLSKEETVFSDDLKYLRPWGADLGIAETAKREAARGIGTKIVELAHGRINDITQDLVIQAAKAKDELAVVTVENAARNLGVRIAYLVNLFNPEVIVIGGGVERAGDLVLKPIKKIVSRFSLKMPADAVRIIPSTLGEEAVALGAASLAVRETFLKA